MIADVKTRQLKVLIAEDHELTSNGLVFSLEKMSDLKVIAEAKNGKEAVRLAEEMQPSIVLMDLVMPLMDGIEATQQIKSRFPHMKVVILTSHQDDQEVFAALAAGAHAYCLKDIELDRLIQVIKMVSEGSIWLDPAIADLVMKSSFMKTKPASSQPATRQQYNTELTEREMEVLRLLAAGKSNKDIAEELMISTNTTKAHVGSIIQKLAVDDRTQAALKAVREGLVSD